jgi:hypothetical protein
MTEEAKAHETNIDLIHSIPANVDAGTEVALRVRVSCRAACDLRGGTVRVIGQGSSVANEVELAIFEEDSNRTDQFTLKAPIELGECTWGVVFPAQEVGGVLHEESSTPLLFNVKPHETSMAVWDFPSPAMINSRFKIKVGVKCTAGCSLMDKEIRVYGQRGKKVATAALGGVPWPGTSALYWAEAELEAPGVEGRYRWRVRFRKPDLELPHEDASCDFAFTTARRPEHVVTVEVIAQESNDPIEKAHVALRSESGYPYRGLTDESGAANVRVPKGEYTLLVSKGSEYAAFKTTIEVSDDATVNAALAPEYHRFV